MRWMLAIPALFAAICVQAAPTTVDVRDYGAVGDGKTDDTAAFTRAMAAVSASGGTVSVGIGNYRIATHLDVPNRVTLEGIWKIPTAWTENQGSTLLAEEGAGSETGTPFITLNANSTLKGITIFYPAQAPEKRTPYPWCVASGGGDNASIIDCLLVNPYQAVDFATRNSGRHYIRGLYGQPLRRGIQVDKCYDVGRIENVHFWPFWKWDEKSGIQAWMWKYSEAFIFARCDWEYVLNTFVFGYGVGYRFIKGPEGPCNGNFLGLGADAARIAVLVEACQAPGLLITNGQFVAFGGENPTEVVVQPGHDGVVQFQNCAFWGPSHQIASIGGTGQVSFNNCNFVHWDREQAQTPAIDLHGGHLTVNGCNFLQPAPQLAITGKAISAIFTSNRLGSPLGITNSAGANLQVGFNVGTAAPKRPVEEAGAVVVDDADGGTAVSFTGQWQGAPAPFGYYRGTRWALKGKGECTAVFRAQAPRAGLYALFAYVGPDPRRDHGSNVPVTIAAAGKTTTCRLDQRRPTGGWVGLGRVRIGADRVVKVTLTNAADANVLADAIKIVPAK